MAFTYMDDYPFTGMVFYSMHFVCLEKRYCNFGRRLFYLKSCPWFTAVIQLSSALCRGPCKLMKYGEIDFMKLEILCCFTRPLLLSYLDGDCLLFNMHKFGNCIGALVPDLLQLFID